MLSWLGNRIATYLEKPGATPATSSTCSPAQLADTILPGDVLLVDGSSRISKAIKYLTQSTWSHATLCVQKDLGNKAEDIQLLEADVLEGVRTIPLSEYAHLHTRICRPKGLSADDIDSIITFGTERIGHQYDTKNIIDLARYLIQTPPVPVGWRRSMLSLGSGDPTRAICSSLVAQCFQSVKYPILPEIITQESGKNGQIHSVKEIMDSQHHSLFTPRDFDISPYFQIVKPTLESGFDHKQIQWLAHSDNSELK